MKIRFACGSILGAAIATTSGFALAQQVDASGQIHQTVVWTVHGDQARSKLPAILDTLRHEASSSNDALRVSALESLAHLQSISANSNNAVYTFSSSVESDGPNAQRAAFAPADAGPPAAGSTQTLTTCVPGPQWAENTSVSQVYVVTNGVGAWQTYATSTWRTTSCKTTV